MGLATFGVIFSQTHLVTLSEVQLFNYFSVEHFWQQNRRDRYYYNRAQCYEHYFRRIFAECLEKNSVFLEINVVITVALEN
jgi:predicted ATP-binding protein involved in virulence